MNKTILVTVWKSLKKYLVNCIHFIKREREKTAILVRLEWREKKNKIDK